MKRLTCVSTVLAAVAVPVAAAAADSNNFGIAVTSDRQEHDLSVPQATKLDLTASHTFANGLILGAGAQYVGNAFSDTATATIEATIGYRMRLDEIFSVVGSVGVGSRLQLEGTGHDFPYYVLRAGADMKLGDIVTWNAFLFRYRDAFDSDDDFLTPQLATGLTFKIDDHNTINGKIQYNWKDWKPDSVGFQLGFGHSF
jgi:hypothetical protein